MIDLSDAGAWGNNFKKMRAYFIFIMTYLLTMTSSVFASDWKVGTYKGQTVASTETSNAGMVLKHDPKAQAMTLQFGYRGDVILTKRNSDQAKFFMRTRKEAKMSGRYDSDYVFTGKTVVIGSPNPKTMQLVTITLSQSDILALRKYEKFGLIGANYYTNRGWRSYTMTAKGLWSAYLKIAPRNGVGSPNAAAQPSNSAQSKKKRNAGTLQCIELETKAAALALKQKRRHKQSGPIMAQLDQLKAEVEQLRAEAKRLELAAKIRQSRTDIQENYGRAVNRYNNAVVRHNSVNEDVRRRSQEYRATQQEQKSLHARIKRECS